MNTGKQTVRGWSIRIRLMALVVTICLLFVGLYAYSIRRAMHYASSEIQTQALRIAQLLASDTDQFIADKRRVLENLALRPLLRIENPPRCDAAFGDFLALFPAFKNVAMSNRSGQIICSAVPHQGTAASVADKPFFKQMMATGLFTVSAPFVGPITGRTVVVLVQPRRDDQGRLLGGLGLPINLDALQKTIGAVDLPRNTVVTIVDSAGLIVTRTREPQHWIGRALNTPALSDRLLDAGQGAFQARDIDGVERYVGFVRVPSTGWRVMVGVPADLVITRAGNLIREDLAVGAVLLLLMLMMAAYASQGIARPLQRLVGAVRRIAAGDGHLRATPAGPAEVIELASEFNALINARDTAERALHEANDTLEQRVAERTQLLNAANQELEAFNYSASHDLRAPLRSIHGFSQALLEDYAQTHDAQAQDYLQRICRACQRMETLIDDLLTLSRTTRGELNPRRVDMAELGTEIAAELAAATPEHKVEFSAQPGLIVDADARLLRIALHNLLANAWKFTARSRAPRVELGRQMRDGSRVYFVRDNGVGFDPQYAHLLFTPFQRLHPGSEFEGNGIGLAIVQRIIHRHGGTVWADGRVDGGTTVYFTLARAIDAVC